MQHHPENGNKLVYSSSEEYLYFSNTSTVFNMSGESVDSADEQQSMVLLTCYIIMACVGTCLNFLVIYVVVLKLLRDHKKPGNCAHLLVAHLSAVSICLAVVTPFNTSDQVYFIPVSGPNCSWVVYMKSTLRLTYFTYLCIFPYVFQYPVVIKFYICVSPHRRVFVLLFNERGSHHFWETAGIWRKPEKLEAVVWVLDHVYLALLTNFQHSNSHHDQKQSILSEI